MSLLRPAPASVLALASLLLSACVAPERAPAATSNESRATSSADASPTAFEVVPLRYAPASELAGLLESVVDRRKVRIQADVRTNALVLAGASADLSTVKELIAALDVELADKR